MTGADERMPLQVGEAPGTESLLDEQRRHALKIWQVLAVAATLALACAATVTGQRHNPMLQLPGRDVSARRVFLSEVLIAEDGKADNGADASDEQPNEDATSAEGIAEALKTAEQLNGKATDFKQQADDLKKQAKELESRTKDLEKKIAERKSGASEDRKEAEKARSEAEDSRSSADELLKKAAQKAKDVQAEAEKEATKMLKEAKQKAHDLSMDAKQKATDLGHESEALDGKASWFDKNAIRRDSAADKDSEQAQTQTQKASSMKSEAEQRKQSALDSEKEARRETADQRTCIGLPGVKLKGYSPATFDPVVGEHKIADDWQCNAWCLRHEDCKQAVFTWETKTCELFTDATTEPEFFRETWPWFNSSYCDTIDKEQDMLAMLHQVYDQKPWVPPPHNCTWGGGNCIHTQCCADVCDASWDFKTCKQYTCYKKDEHFAGCKTGGPPENWDGSKLGVHPNGEVAPAEEGKLIQGTKLYCFTVVMWSVPAKEAWMASEGELANNWKQQKKGIMQCDDYSIFDGLAGGSVHNIQSFINAWKMVKDDGRWKRNDWSIKVDPDAVFFPDHFRKKVEWQYKTPQGSALYMRNTFYKFQFLGALEAVTREGMEVYYERGWECEAHLGQQGGEDYWLLQCLEGLGLDFQTDVALLHDKYAADQACDDPNGVAHHFFKKISGNGHDGWNGCWEIANKAWNDAHPE